MREVGPAKTGTASTGARIFVSQRPTTLTLDEKRQQDRPQHPTHWRGKDMGIRQPKWSANSMIAGAGGGLVASIATCPLDVVKTKL